MKIIKLTEICNPKQWKTLSTEQLLSSGYSVYGANGKIGYFNDYNHENPTVMITCRGATCGAINLSEPKSWINGNAMCLDDLSENVNLRYLVHYLSNYDFRNVISGSAQPQITRENLNKVTIKLYDPKKQEEIANNLDKIKKIIEQHKSLLLKYDTLIKSRFIEMFGDPVQNPMKWEKKNLSEWCTKVTDGTHDTPPRYTRGVLLLTGKNIRADHIDFSEIEYVSPKDHKIIYERCNPEYGDVLYTNIGVNYGTAVLNTLDYQFSMKNIALLKPKRDLVSGYYLWFVLNLLRNKILDENKTGGAQTFMSLSAIRSLIIPMPPISLQNDFAAFVQQIDKSKFEIEKIVKMVYN